MAEADDFPADPWRLIERTYNSGYIEQTETLFALSNGFLGIRASFEEGEPSYRPATLLNGFHETWPITYPEVMPACAMISRPSAVSGSWQAAPGSA